jgi:hypothetical protein
VNIPLIGTAEGGTPDGKLKLKNLRKYRVNMVCFKVFQHILFDNKG